MVTPPPVGLLALQGDFDAHRRALEALGSTGRPVRFPRDLDGLRGLILPGGESTTLLKLLRDSGLEQALPGFHEAGGALFGTCAGTILLASGVTDPRQRSLGLIDVDVRRNAYGRQRESFETARGVPEPPGPGPHEGLGEGDLEMVLIRAPRLTRLGRGVQVLARLAGEPVLVRQGRVLAATFHPELGADRRVHRYFLGMAAEAGAAGPTPG